MHTFKNFKNFEYAEIDLSKPMTLLIGRNGSGKSNVIEGVELLAELIKGREIHEISDIGRGSSFEIRGNLQSCFKQGNKAFEIGFQDSIWFEDKKQPITYKITAKLEHSIQINREAIVNGKNLLGRLPSQAIMPSGISSGASASAGASLAFGLGLIPLVGVAAALLGAAAFAATNQKEQLQISQSLSNSQLLLKKYIDTHVFDIYPRAIREYVPIGQQLLSKNGSNLSSVLYYLKQNSPDILEKILELIRQLPEEAFESFEFITTSDNSDVLFALKYPNGEIISAKLLSDGTLRALAILTALETVPEGSRIIIEEIDNGVHASRVHVLIEAIWEASNRRHLNTLITTHNPATLDSLNDEQLECVVVCHYDKQGQSAKLTPFFELPNVYELMERGKLGSLVVKNIIEQHLDPKFEAERKRIALEWLESMN